MCWLGVEIRGQGRCADKQTGKAFLCRWHNINKDNAKPGRVFFCWFRLMSWRDSLPCNGIQQYSPGAYELASDIAAVKVPPTRAGLDLAM